MLTMSSMSFPTSSLPKHMTFGFGHPVVKLPLIAETITDDENSFQSMDYNCQDDDIASVTDQTDVGMCLSITPYPGYAEFPIWIESQFPDIIPQCTASFLQ